MSTTSSIYWNVSCLAQRTAGDGDRVRSILQKRLRATAYAILLDTGQEAYPDVPDNNRPLINAQEAAAVLLRLRSEGRHGTAARLSSRLDELYDIQQKLDASGRADAADSVARLVSFVLHLDGLAHEASAAGRADAALPAALLGRSQALPPPPLKPKRSPEARTEVAVTLAPPRDPQEALGLGLDGVPLGRRLRLLPPPSPPVTSDSGAPEAVPLAIGTPGAAGNAISTGIAAAPETVHGDGLADHVLIPSCARPLSRTVDAGNSKAAAAAIAGWFPFRDSAGLPLAPAFDAPMDALLNPPHGSQAGFTAGASSSNAGFSLEANLPNQGLFQVLGAALAAPDAAVPPLGPLHSALATARNGSRESVVSGPGHRVAVPVVVEGSAAPDEPTALGGPAALQLADRGLVHTRFGHINPVLMNLGGTQSECFSLPSIDQATAAAWAGAGAQGGPGLDGASDVIAGAGASEMPGGGGYPVPFSLSALGVGGQRGAWLGPMPGSQPQPQSQQPLRAAYSAAPATAPGSDPQQRQQQPLQPLALNALAGLLAYSGGGKPQRPQLDWSGVAAAAPAYDKAYGTTCGPLALVGSAGGRAGMAVRRSTAEEEALVYDMAVMGLQGVGSALWMLRSSMVRSHGIRLASQRRLLMQLSDTGELRLRLGHFAAAYGTYGNPAYGSSSQSDEALAAFADAVRQLLVLYDGELQELAAVNQPTVAPAGRSTGAFEAPGGKPGTQPGPPPARSAGSSGGLLGLFLCLAPLRIHLQRLADVCMCVPDPAWIPPPGAAARERSLARGPDGAPGAVALEGRLPPPIAPSLWQVYGFPQGADLLDRLYDSLLQADLARTPLLRLLFAAACSPYMRRVRAWMYDTVDCAVAAAAAAQASAAEPPYSGANVIGGAAAFAAVPPSASAGGAGPPRPPAFAAPLQRLLTAAGLQMRLLQELGEELGGVAGRIRGMAAVEAEEVRLIAQQYNEALAPASSSTSTTVASTTAVAGSGTHDQVLEAQRAPVAQLQGSAAAEGGADVGSQGTTTKEASGAQGPPRVGSAAGSTGGSMGGSADEFTYPLVFGLAALQQVSEAAAAAATARGAELTSLLALLQRRREAEAEAADARALAAAQEALAVAEAARAAKAAAAEERRLARARVLSEQRQTLDERAARRRLERERRVAEEQALLAEAVLKEHNEAAAALAAELARLRASFGGASYSEGGAGAGGTLAAGGVLGADERATEAAARLKRCEWREARMALAARRRLLWQGIEAEELTALQRLVAEARRAQAAGGQQQRPPAELQELSGSAPAAVPQGLGLLTIPSPDTDTEMASAFATPTGTGSGQQAGPRTASEPSLASPLLPPQHPGPQPWALLDPAHALPSDLAVTAASPRPTSSPRGVPLPASPGGAAAGGFPRPALSVRAPAPSMANSGLAGTGGPPSTSTTSYIPPRAASVGKPRRSTVHDFSFGVGPASPRGTTAASPGLWGRASDGGALAPPPASSAAGAESPGVGQQRTGCTPPPQRMRPGARPHHSSAKRSLSATGTGTFPGSRSPLTSPMAGSGFGGSGPFGAEPVGFGLQGLAEPWGRGGPARRLPSSSGGATGVGSFGGWAGGRPPQNRAPTPSRGMFRSNSNRSVAAAPGGGWGSGAGPGPGGAGGGLLLQLHSRRRRWAIQQQQQQQHADGGGVGWGGMGWGGSSAQGGFAEAWSVPAAALQGGSPWGATDAAARKADVTTLDETYGNAGEDGTEDTAALASTVMDAASRTPRSRQHWKLPSAPTYESAQAAGPFSAWMSNRGGAFSSGSASSPVKALLRTYLSGVGAAPQQPAQPAQQQLLPVFSVGPSPRAGEPLYTDPLGVNPRGGMADELAASPGAGIALYGSRTADAADVEDDVDAGWGAGRRAPVVSEDLAYAPVGVAVQTCLYGSVLAQYRLTTRAVWHVMVHEYKLVTFLQALRRFFFCEAGDVAGSLADSLVRRLEARPHLVPSTAELRAMLDEALQGSSIAPTATPAGALRPRSGKGDGANGGAAGRTSARGLYGSDADVAAGVSAALRVRSVPRRSLGAGGYFASDALLVTCSVPNPLGAVVTAASMRSYSDIFSLLLRIRCAMSVLASCWAAINAATCPLVAQELGPPPGRRRGGAARRGPGGLGGGEGGGEGGAAAAGGGVHPLWLKRLAVARLWLQAATQVVSLLVQHLQVELRGRCWEALEASLRGPVPQDLVQMREAHDSYLAACREVCMLPPLPPEGSTTAATDPWTTSANAGARGATAPVPPPPPSSSFSVSSRAAPRSITAPPVLPGTPLMVMEVLQGTHALAAVLRRALAALETHSLAGGGLEAPPRQPTVAPVLTAVHQGAQAGGPLNGDPIGAGPILHTASGGTPGTLGEGSREAAGGEVMAGDLDELWAHVVLCQTRLGRAMGSLRGDLRPVAITGGLMGELAAVLSSEPCRSS